ncbi:protein chibby homolog 1-like isoform X2 [Corticium candelabrum]|uniref:protein chibby homolog 1-like isoform X2 n=1 Tax=Corticium candelabrum TaxID=121492 RepID=UPI002E26F55E|nr:protein chibby homolog 1-like isoform X2 [Corticium candelabrum]
MPLFGRNKGFVPNQKTPRRKSASLTNLSSLDDSVYSQNDLQVDGGGPIRVCLGGQELVFEDGNWITESGSGAESSREVVRLKKHIRELTEENNLLKFKNELLLDMLVASNADSLVQQKELEALKARRGGGTKR